MVTQGELHESGPKTVTIATRELLFDFFSQSINIVGNVNIIAIGGIKVCLFLWHNDYDL